MIRNNQNTSKQTPNDILICFYVFFLHFCIILSNPEWISWKNKHFIYFPIFRTFCPFLVILPVSNNEYLVKEGLMLFFITIDAACRDIEVNCTHPINIFLEFGPPTRLGWRDRLKYFRNMNPQMKSFNEILQWNDDRGYCKIKSLCLPH